MNRYIMILTHWGHVEEILFDKVFPTQNSKTFNITFRMVKPHLDNFFKSTDIEKIWVEDK